MSQKTPNIINKLFSINMRRFRKEKGLTIAKLSEALNISKTTIIGYENNRTFPTTKVFARLCKILNKTPKEFLYTERDHITCNFANLFLTEAKDKLLEEASFLKNSLDKLSSPSSNEDKKEEAITPS